MSDVRSQWVRGFLGAGVSLSMGLSSLLWATAASATDSGTSRTIQIVATNDFHGRLSAAPAMAGAVGELREREPNTLFVGVGDQIGGSTFESFIAQDRPTLQALNAMGLAVSAVGNHEYDQGHGDLVGRVLAPHDPVANPLGGAQWPYLAANLHRSADGVPALEDATRSRDGATWMTRIDGVDVGFVGVVTEQLPMLVRPTGLAGIRVGSAVQAANQAADRLTAAGADVVVALVHEGALGTSRAAITDPATAFGRIVTGLDEDVDVIFSGHTHLEYAHVIAGRPVLQGGSYGTKFSRVVLDVDASSGEVQARTADVLPVEAVPAVSTPAQALRDEVGGIVAAAQGVARDRGDMVLGRIDGDARRALTGNGLENRGGESTLGNLVAEAHRWATASPESGGAQIAFMNPGGLRADLIGVPGSGNVTYRDAALVQPFANSLMTMQMTGAQIKQVLEEQWQRDESGAALTGRPLRRLGVSQGLTYTYDSSRRMDDRITGMWLHGKPLSAVTLYGVAANNFLAGGGDNFVAFRSATEARDSGRTDLEATVEYIGAQQTVRVPRDQRAVEVVVPDAVWTPGETYTMDVASWSFSEPGAVRDEDIGLWHGDTQWAKASVDHTVDVVPEDGTGRARITVRVPDEAPAGPTLLELRGVHTDTAAPVEVVIGPRVVAAPTLHVHGPNAVYAGRGKARWTISVSSDHSVVATGSVTVHRAGKVVGRVRLRAGRGTVTLTGLRAPGTRSYTFRYAGDERHATTSRTKQVKIRRTPVAVSASVDTPVRVGTPTRVRVQVRPGHGVKERKSAAVRRSVTGKVRLVIREAGGRVTARVIRLRAGAVTVPHTFSRRGVAQVTTAYLGNSTSRAHTVTLKAGVRAAGLS